MGVALATIVWGALGTLPQTSLKRILAYSTINQLGYIAFGISLLSPLGMTAAVFYIVSHAFLKSSMLLGAGLNQKLTGTVNLDEMGGMMKKAPYASALLLVGFHAVGLDQPDAGQRLAESGGADAMGAANGRGVPFRVIADVVHGQAVTDETRP